MNFLSVTFPERIAFGAQSEPNWSTEISEVLSGREMANENWEDARHKFDVSFAIRTVSDYQLVRQHFHEVRGRANAFPFKDFLDFTVTTAQGLLIDDAGAVPVANGTYHLARRYGSTNPYDRLITRPDNPIHVFRTRSAVTTDITGVTGVVTYAGGTVVISSHVAGDTYTWSGTFKIPCRYDTDKLPGIAENKEPAHDGELWVTVSSIPICEVRE